MGRDSAAVNVNVANKDKPETLLLLWSKQVPASDVQDPLGLGLRGSTRLASRLLFCITSITPRARYFSFIPWCILDYRRNEMDKAFSQGLKDAIVFRERALTLGCIVHHEGRPCKGGGLVGSDKASKWFEQKNLVADFTKKALGFAKNPAMDAYSNSLQNLGCFLTDDDRQVVDEESQEQITFEDLQLSELGLRLAESYDSMVGTLESVELIATARRRSQVQDLAAWGEQGGLCEVSSDSAKDRKPLRDMFFNKNEAKGASHSVRKQSLLLILDIARQVQAKGLSLDEECFSTAVYFGSIYHPNGSVHEIKWPKRLVDIAMRWRMFYFHHFMSVALEGMFSWLVTSLGDSGVAGDTLADMLQPLHAAAVSSHLNSFFEVTIPADFGNQTPATFLELFGLHISELNEETSATIDSHIGLDSSLSEVKLEDAIRENWQKHTATGVAIPVLLLSTTLSRYVRWSQADYGNWLASIARDEYLDLIPPVVLRGMQQRLDDWWNSSFSDITRTVLSRFIVQQHQSMSYEKSKEGNRCLLQVDGPNISITGTYDKIGMGNPRLISAIQILKDLAYLADNKEGEISLTKDGKRLLQEELSGEGQYEIH